MGIVGRYLERRATYQQALSTFKDPGQWLIDWFGGGTESASGQVVNERTALALSAVYGCVHIIAETIATLPLFVYERTKAGKEKAIDHPLFPILHDEFSEDIASLNAREMLTGHCATWGNAYAFIERNGRGQVLSITPLRPDRMKPERTNGKTTYTYTHMVGGVETPRTYAPFDILHVAGMGFDGLIGYSPIRIAMQAIGLGMATEKFGSALFKRGARPSGILRTPKVFKTDDARKAFKNSFLSAIEGEEGWLGVPLLEEGMEWQALGVPPDEAQFLETRKLQVVEVCRFYRMQPHKIQHLDNATFSNIEHQAIEHVVDTILPWARRWEAEFNRKCFMPSERGRFYAQFNLAGLLRGDIKARFEAYHIARGDAWLNANEIRELEDMNNMGEQGDVYLAPLNMVPLDQLLEPPDPAPAPPAADPGEQPPPAEGEPPAPQRGSVQLHDLIGLKRALGGRESRGRLLRRRIEKAYRTVYAEAVGRIVRREVKAIRRAIEKHLTCGDLDGFNATLDAFWSQERQIVRDGVLGVTVSMAEAVAALAAEDIGQAPGDTVPFGVRVQANDLADQVAHAHIVQARDAINTTISANPAAALAGPLDQTLQRWEERVPGDTAFAEVKRISGVIARLVWMDAGVQTFGWHVHGDCDSCAHVGTQITMAGQLFELADGTRVSNPPLHSGCDCDLIVVR